MDVSIIIVSWNTRDILHRCLQSVYEQTDEITFEVIVIDNASSDGSAEMVEREFAQVRLIKNTENRGFAAANNQGAEIARGRYLLLLNSDTIVLDNAIGKTVKFADEYSEAGVVGCRVLNPDRTLQPTGFMFPSALNMLLAASYLYKLFPRHKFFGREQMTCWGRDDVREVDVVTGCFMLARREAIEQVGMMDESFFMYGEETDWCWRFKKAGWQNLFYPGAEIIHLGGQSTRQVKPQMILQLKAGLLRFIRKHRTARSYATACFLTSAWFGLRVIPWLLAGVLGIGERRNAWLTAKTYATGVVKSFGGYKALSVRT